MTATENEKLIYRCQWQRRLGGIALAAGRVHISDCPARRAYLFNLAQTHDHLGLSKLWLHRVGPLAQPARVGVDQAVSSRFVDTIRELKTI